jgi:AcrR family transcriptional regulator
MSSGNASDLALPARVPQRRRGRDRVAALQAAAASLFLEKGFDATTMTEIALRAGASIGSLYLFFPTKQALGQSMLTTLAEDLSGRLDALQPTAPARTAAAIGDAVFAALSAFMADHPVYAVLIDLRGDDDWKHTMRARRRSQIAALFAHAVPPLPKGQAERLALIVPELMKISLHLSGMPPRKLRDEVLSEVRGMLRHHLEYGDTRARAAECQQIAG